ncbi:hypothetical protein QQP08_005837 [Theobroma cacao]|nr:hypothetical protein QQP08_005837 [Theobroma cacao]
MANNHSKANPTKTRCERKDKSLFPLYPTFTCTKPKHKFTSMHLIIIISNIKLTLPTTLNHFKPIPSLYNLTTSFSSFFMVPSLCFIDLYPNKDLVHL